MCLRKYFAEQGILHQASCVGTPQENGRAERNHRHILNMARSLLFQVHLPIKFWVECILTAAYLINRTPTPLLDGKSPHEILHSSPPAYSHLRVLGSLCFAKKQTAKTYKFEARSRRCIFIGYPLGPKGWRVFNLETNGFFVSRDVIFHETSFPFATSKPSLPTPIIQPPPASQQFEEIIDTSSPVQINNDRGSDLPTTEKAPVETLPESTSPVLSSSSPIDENSKIEEDPPNENSLEPLPETSSDELLGRGQRTKVPSIRLKPYVTYSARCDINPVLNSIDSTSTSSGTCLYAIANYVFIDGFSPKHTTFLAAITLGDEPIHFRDAMKLKVWRDSMGTEYVALEDNNTWSFQKLPPGKKALACKWVYSIKYNQPT